jgi:hypothetical protein
MKLIDAGLSGAEIISRLQKGHMVRRACWIDDYYVRICNEDGFDENGNVIFDECSSIGVYVIATDDYFMHVGFSAQPFRDNPGKTSRSGEGFGALFAEDWEDYGFISREEFNVLTNRFKLKIREIRKQIREEFYNNK